MSDKFSDKGKKIKDNVKNKLNELVNTVERHTRTERHMEQNAGRVTSHDNLEHEKEIQKKRENDINHIEDKIMNKSGVSNAHEFENLKDNYEASDDYLKANKDHMTKEDAKNLEARQENRADTINAMKKNDHEIK